MAKRQIVLDTETTGLNPLTGDRIIEIGCLELVERRPTGRTFHHYINPERAVDVGAQAVHGISNDFLKDKPLFAEIADDFFVFCDGAELIIHNAPFDVGFINAEFRLLNFHTNDIGKHCDILDSLPLARQKHPGQANNLDALCKRYSVDSSGREYHGALLDAQLLAQVYLAMTSEQGSLFGGARAEHSQHKAIKKTQVSQPAEPKQQYDLPVIKADAASVQLHEAFMKDVLKQG